MARPLQPEHAAYLGKLCEMRRDAARTAERPDPVPTEDGAAIEWCGNEKFYHHAEWIEYLVDRVREDGSVAAHAGERV